MGYEVVVVGAGLGGLTAGALLAARGASVCVVERASQVGGCAASFEKFGYAFEPTAGLYAGWGEGETHARLFAELRAAPPRARRLSPAYTVRLADGTQVRVGMEDWAETEEDLRATFPECSALAVGLFDEMLRLADADEAARAQSSNKTGQAHTWLRRIGWRGKGLEGGGRNDATRAEIDAARAQIGAARSRTVAARLADAPPRLRRFVDAQLQLFASCASEECSLLDAALALAPARRGLYALAGGARAHADALAESIKKNGGAIRLDTTALRLAYDPAGAVAGVDLLSGETVRASRAVVSNMTAWDTYGKLVGAGRTSADVRARLKRARGWGAYLVFAGMDDEAASRLPSERVIAINEEGGGAFDPARSMFALNVAPAWGARAPQGKRAATLAAFADASEWFAYHEDEAEHEAKDESALARWWERLHAALPEIGGGCEVIETATPRAYYEQTRRRLGAAWGLARTRVLAGDPLGHRTHLPKLYAVGDTAAHANGVEAVTRAALAVADEIAPRG